MRQSTRGCPGAARTWLWACSSVRHVCLCVCVQERGSVGGGLGLWMQGTVVQHGPRAASDLSLCARKVQAPRRRSNEVKGPGQRTSMGFECRMGGRVFVFLSPKQEVLFMREGASGPWPAPLVQCMRGSIAQADSASPSMLAAHRFGGGAPRHPARWSCATRGGSCTAPRSGPPP